MQNYCWAETLQETLVDAYAKLGTFQDQGRCTQFSGTDSNTYTLENAQTFYLAGVGAAFKRTEKRPGIEKGLAIRLHRGVWQLANWGFDPDGFFNGANLDAINKPSLSRITQEGGWADSVSPGLMLLDGGFPVGLNPLVYLCTRKNLRISCQGTKTSDAVELWLSSAHLIVRRKRMVGTTTSYCEFSPKSAVLKLPDLDIAIPKVVSKVVAWNLKEKFIAPDALKAALAGDKHALQALVPWELRKVDEKLALKLLYMAARARAPDAEAAVANQYQERYARTANSPGYGMSADALLKKRISLLQKAADHCDSRALAWLTGNEVTDDAALRTKMRRKQMECYVQSLPEPIPRPNW